MKNKCTLCCAIKKLWDDLINVSIIILAILSIFGVTAISVYIIGLVGNYFYPLSPMVHYNDIMNIFVYGLIISIFALAIVTIIVTSVFIIYKAFEYLLDLYYDCR